jgi:hypothetical protein
MSIVLHAFPTDDPAFRERVAGRLAEAEDEDGLLERIGHLLIELRAEYPLVRIRLQNDLAALPGTRVVYAYRDGHAIPLRGDGPGAMRRLRPLEASVVGAAETLARSVELWIAASQVAARATAVLDRVGEQQRARRTFGVKPAEAR